MSSNVRLLLALACACGIAGCRLERSPAASPFAVDADGLQGQADDGDPEDEPSDPSASGGASASGSGGAGGMAPAGAGGSADPNAGNGGESGAGGMSSAGSGGGSAGSPIEPDASVISDSCDPVVALCNPVTNEGCEPPMQCAVDALSDVLAGYCIFNGPVADGCFNSGVTESCPPTETCLDFECRKLCFCDDDCAEGQCCVDPVGDLGFKACGAC